MEGLCECAALTSKEKETIKHLMAPAASEFTEKSIRTLGPVPCIRYNNFTLAFSTVPLDFDKKICEKN